MIPMRPVHYNSASSYTNSTVRFGGFWKDWHQSAQAMSAILGPNHKVIIQAHRPPTKLASVGHHHTVVLERDPSTGELIASAFDRETPLTSPDGVPIDVKTKVRIEPHDGGFYPIEGSLKVYPKAGQAYPRLDTRSDATRIPATLPNGRDTIVVHYDEKTLARVAPVYIKQALLKGGTISIYPTQGSRPITQPITNSLQLPTQPIVQFVS
jgi:hypothetical protein